MSKRHRSNPLPSAALELTSGAEFNTYTLDPALGERAHLEGERGIPDPTLYGANREPTLQHEVAKTAAVAQAVQAHKLATDLGPLIEELEESYPEVVDLEDEALMAIDAMEHAVFDRYQLRRKILDAGYRLPKPIKARQALIAVFTVIAGISELFILGPAYQTLGLSDRPLIPFLPFTPQHVAALGSVIMLVVLAHSLGKRATDPSPPEGWWRRLIVAGEGHWLSIFGIAMLLLGLATVRERFLVEKSAVAAAAGQHLAGQGGIAVAIGFLMLNVGFVLGVGYLSRPDPRPFAEVWLGAEQELADETGKAKEALEDYEHAVGGYNTNVARVENLLLQHGFAFDAIVADAGRQLWLIVGETRLALREPVNVSMYSAVMPTVEKHKLQEEITSFLRGAEGTRFHRYQRFDTEPIRERFKKLHGIARRQFDNSELDTAAEGTSPTEAPDKEALKPSSRQRPSARKKSSSTGNGSGLVKP